MNFLRKHNFDGLSFEWNYPKCWQSDCRKGPDTDKPNFTKLVRELRYEFDRQQPRLTLAVALSGYKEVIDRAYEVQEISDAVDFMTVMTYDYHGAWESKTGHLSPLFGSPADSNPFYNVVSCPCNCIEQPNDQPRHWKSFRMPRWSTWSSRARRGRSF